jgi:hypothetical protein
LLGAEDEDELALEELQKQVELGLPTEVGLHPV